MPKRTEIEVITPTECDDIRMEGELQPDGTIYISLPSLNTLAIYPDGTKEMHSGSPECHRGKLSKAVWIESIAVSRKRQPPR